MNHNIAELFRSRYAEFASKPFLCLPDGDEYSFQAMDLLAQRFAGLLAELGVADGDRVVVQVDKSPAAVALYLACLRYGAVFVPLNTAYTPAEVQFFLEDAAPALFVCRSETYSQSRDAAAMAGVPCVRAMGGGADEGLWAEASQQPPREPIESKAEDDLAAILYTSGTTGRSKGAMLSHGNLASNALVLHEHWRFEPGDVLIHALPIFHVHGLFVALHCALLNASTVLFHARFDPAEVVKAMRSGASVLMGVPTFYTRLLSLPDFTAEDCRHIRLFVSGSAPMTEQTHAQWTERTGHRILERYGMTEAGMITSNPYDGERIPGTVGYPLRDIEVRVCGDDGHEAPRGEPGSVEVRGPNVFRGYWKLPEKTRSEFRDDGYFITGDIGVMSEDGRLSLVGRGKDLIISGGYNIYPKEIELVLDTFPGVRESAVVGQPDPDFGESVVAYIACDPGAAPDPDAIAKFLQDRLARFKQPRRYEFIDELPRNTMGKVQKNALRELALSTR